MKTPSTCAIGDLATSAKAKLAPVTFDGALLRQALGSPEAPLTCPFNVGSFDPGATRVNICFKVPPDVAAYVRQVEGLLVDEVQRQSARLLGRELTKQATLDCFTSGLKQGAMETMRCKLNLLGTSRPCRVWAPDGTAREMPEDVRTCEVVPMVEVRSIWINGGRFGAMWEVTDLRVNSVAVKCPWA